MDRPRSIAAEIADDLLTTKRIAVLTGVSEETVRRRIRDNTLPAIRLGTARNSQYRVRRSDLAALFTPAGE